MLKRIWELHDRIDPICNEILDLIPKQYQEHDLVKGRHRDDERRKRLFELWQRDPVSANWIELYWRALLLPGDLRDVAGSIEDRAKRNGVNFEGPSSPASAESGDSKTPQTPAS